MKTERFKDARVGVLMGGLSSEREVSLETGAGVLAGLRARGYDAVGLDWTEATPLPVLLADAKIDVVWIALHGTHGEDGAVQGLLQCIGLPYTGSGILASALAMDKIASKRIFASHDLATPRWAEVPRDAASIPAGFATPLVIKPADEGSSVGVTIVREPGQIPAALALARSCRGATLVEEYLAGAELAVGILGEEIIGSVEIAPSVEFYDYEAKYKREDTRYLVPPQVDAALVAQAEALSLAAFQALGCTGYGRVDLRIDTARGEPSLLEVNTLPGMTSHSLLPKIAAHRGMDYATLCERILQTAHL